MARLNDCQILSHYPFGMPTLRAYPPPPPSRHRTPVPASRPRTSNVLPFAPPPARSRTYRRKHDCMYIPDFHEIAELVDARRHLLAIETRRPAKPSRVAPREAPLESPIAIGLLLTILPPLGVTMLWSSPRFSRAAKVAVTVYGALTLFALAAAITFGLR